jgi:hypothetical protein
VSTACTRPCHRPVRPLHIDAGRAHRSRTLLGRGSSRGRWRSRRGRPLRLVPTVAPPPTRAPDPAAGPSEPRLIGRSVALSATSGPGPAADPPEARSIGGLVASSATHGPRRSGQGRRTRRRHRLVGSCATEGRRAERRPMPRGRSPCATRMQPGARGRRRARREEVGPRRECDRAADATTNHTARNAPVTA